MLPYLAGYSKMNRKVAKGVARATEHSALEGQHLRRMVLKW